MRLEHRADGEELVDRRGRRFRLVRYLGVRHAVHVVAHALHDALLFKPQRALMGTDERKELENCVSRLQVHHIRAAALHDACLDPLVGEQGHKPLGEGLGLDGNLEVEVAARVRDETAAQKRAAHVGCGAALLGHDVWTNANLQAAFLGDDAQIKQRFGQMGLRGNLDQVVWRLMEHAAAHGELGSQLVDAMQKLDYKARNARHIRGDFNAIAPRTGDEQRSLDTHERGERCLPAMRALGQNARKLVFYFRRERHSLSTPQSASRKASGSCQVGRLWSTRSRTITRGPWAWIAMTSS